MTSIYDYPPAHMHVRQEHDGSVVVQDSITRRCTGLDPYTFERETRRGDAINHMVQQLIRVRRAAISAFLTIRYGHRDWYALLGIHAYPVMRLASELYDATKELCQGEIAGNPCLWYDWYDPCSYYRGCGAADIDSATYQESANVLWDDPCMRYSQYKMTAEVKGYSGVYT